MPLVHPFSGTLGEPAAQRHTFFAKPLAFFEKACYNITVCEFIRARNLSVVCGNVINLSLLKKRKDFINVYIQNNYLDKKILSKLEDEELIKDLAKKIKEDHLSVRELENIVANPDYKRKNPIIKIKEDYLQL